MDDCAFDDCAIDDCVLAHFTGITSFRTCRLFKTQLLELPVEVILEDII
jgi:hypothetical protein